MKPQLTTKIYSGDIIFNQDDFESYRFEVENNGVFKLIFDEKYRNKKETIKYLKALISLVENLEV